MVGMRSLVFLLLCVGFSEGIRWGIRFLTKRQRSLRELFLMVTYWAVVMGIFVYYAKMADWTFLQP